MVKVIILDFDGTLGDTRANIVLTMQQTLKKRGYPVADEDTIAATIGLPLEKGFRQLLGGISDAETAACASTYREVFEINKKLLIPRLFPKVRETLAELKEEGYVLTIASSRSSRSLKGFLSDMEVEGYITYILGADIVRLAKPDPAGALTCGVTYGNSSKDDLLAAGADYVIDDFASLLQLLT